jgi:hypothetical protein
VQRAGRGWVIEAQEVDPEVERFDVEALKEERGEENELILDDLAIDSENLSRAHSEGWYYDEIDSEDELSGVADDRSTYDP